MSAGMGPWVSAIPTLAAQTAADPGRPTTRLSSPRLHIRLVRHVRVLEVLRDHSECLTDHEEIGA